MGTKSKTAPQQVAVAQRRAFVLELRMSGARYAEIAKAALEHFGADALPRSWSDRTAHKDVAFELARLREEAHESAEAIREIELERLKEADLAIWDKVLGGNLAAIDRMLKIQDRRAKLLGIDAPQQLEVADLRVNVHYNEELPGESMSAEHSTAAN